MIVWKLTRTEAEYVLGLLEEAAKEIKFAQLLVVDLKQSLGMVADPQHVDDAEFTRDSTAP